MTQMGHRTIDLVVSGLILMPALAALPATASRIESRIQDVSSEPAAGDEYLLRIPVGRLVEKVACNNDPTQTYTLYLPTRYTTEHAWPVLFVFDPRGRSSMAAEIFRDAAERYGWILMSSDNTRSDGPWDPNFKAVAAMGPDLSRYAYDKDRIYAAGFSGGAMLAWLWGQQAGNLAGVIASGGRPVRPPASETEVPFAFFGAAGVEEFNYEPTLELDTTAARLGAPHRFESFPGPHAWMPAALALEAIEWMELQAMRSGTRKRDSALVAALYEKNLDRARNLESAGDALRANRRFDAIVRTFEGLMEPEEAVARAAALAKSAKVKKMLAAETSARRYERDRRQQIERGLSLFKARRAETGQPSVMDMNQLEFELRLTPLLKTAKESTAKGFAARRALNSLSVQLGFYLPREFFQVQDYERAAVVLELATRIEPPRPFVLYNLASALARSGKRRKAMSALADAVEAGFSNVEHLEQDPDLEALRKLPAYQDLIARMRGSVQP